MKSLTQLLQDIKVIEKRGVDTSDFIIDHITIQSNNVVPKSLFIAVKGSSNDGHLFVDDAIKNGAIVVVVEQFPESLNPKVGYIKVESTKNIVGKIAGEFYDHPSRKLKLVGVTGTNGKTTVATILYGLFKQLGNKVGLISTVENCTHDMCEPATLTTPDSITLNKMLNKMVNEGCTYAFMECSSHAIEQGRINGLEFAGGIFTNLTHDHLDYHGTFSNYRDAKKSFFENHLNASAFAICNIDDKNGFYMIQNTKATCCTYSFHKAADYKIKMLNNSLTEGLEVAINKERFISPLVGNYNALNLAAVFACAEKLGIAKEKICIPLSKQTGAKGRMQIVHSIRSNGAIGIVDYAHTPDALQNVLHTIKEVKKLGQQIISVVGCGGNRDVSKRSAMGKIACLLSDIVVFTSDNPRDEDPAKICEQMCETLDEQDKKKLHIIIDRKLAIQKAVSLAKKNDIVLVAGKGHEEYQMIGKEKKAFSEIAILSDKINKSS